LKNVAFFTKNTKTQTFKPGWYSRVQNWRL